MVPAMTAPAVSRKKVIGSERPRIAPPTPARSGLKGFEAAATELGIDLFPWQRTAARYITALGQGERWLYRHVAVVVARQNGKTTLLLPLIVDRMLKGDRIMHTAQDRVIPREVFTQVADYFMTKHPELLAQRNGRPIKPRFANGTEEIRLASGGLYAIVAPSRSGA